MLNEDEMWFLTEVKLIFLCCGGENKFGEESLTKLEVATNYFFGV